jgi:hypothetical protein
LWVAVEEHPHDLAQRALAFGADPERLVVLGPTDEPLDVLRDAVEAVLPALVVVDTLPTWADSFVEDARSATSWTPVMAALTAVARESGAAVVLLHHARKSDGAYRDSSAIGAGVDVILEMNPHSEDPCMRTLRARGRWAMLGFAIRLVGNAYELAGGELSLDARVLLYIERTPGCSGQRVREGIGGRAADLDAALRRLLDRGAVEDTGQNGRHAYVTSSRTPSGASSRDGIGTGLVVPRNSLGDKDGTGSGRDRSSGSQTVGTGNGTTPLSETPEDAERAGLSGGL